MKPSKFTFQSLAGNPWLVRVVSEGETYGLSNCLKHTGGEPLVEFYDARYPHNFDSEGPLGQFVSRYYLSTLRDHSPANGLNLYGGEPSWSLAATDMAKVLRFLDQVQS